MITIVQQRLFQLALVSVSKMVLPEHMEILRVFEEGGYLCIAFLSYPTSPSVEYLVTSISMYTGMTMHNSSSRLSLGNYLGTVEMDTSVYNTNPEYIPSYDNSLGISIPSLPVSRVKLESAYSIFMKKVINKGNSDDVHVSSPQNVLF